MKFGKKLAEVTAGEWREHYVAYKPLKKLLQRLYEEHGSGNHEAAASAFRRAFKRELARLNLFFAKQEQRLLESARRLSEEVGAGHEGAKIQSEVRRDAARPDAWLARPLSGTEQQIGCVAARAGDGIAPAAVEVVDAAAVLRRKLAVSAAVDGDGGSPLLQRVLDFSHEVDRLRQYVVINYVAVLKILKKFDKRFWAGRDAGRAAPRAGAGAKSDGEDGDADDEEERAEAAGERDVAEAVSALGGPPRRPMESPDAAAYSPLRREMTALLLEQPFYESLHLASLFHDTEALAARVMEDALGHENGGQGARAGADDEAWRCPVCMEACVNPVALACGHPFCWTCLAKLSAQGSQRCPVCRAEQSLDPVNFQICGLLGRFSRKYFPEVVAGEAAGAGALPPREAAAAGGGPAAPSAPPLAGAPSLAPLAGSLGAPDADTAGKVALATIASLPPLACGPGEGATAAAGEGRSPFAARSPHRRPLAVAHRGASGYLPANTLRAFDEAVRLGCDMIELDVRACGSGELVVVHDPTTRSGALVARTPLAKLREEEVPTLGEALDCIAQRAAVYFDLKGDGVVGPTLEHLRYRVACRGWDPRLMVVASFNQYHIAELRGLLAEHAATMGGLRVALLIAGVPMGLAQVGQAVGADLLVTSQECCTPSIVADAHARGLPLLVYTVNKPAMMRHLLDMGVDGVIGDFVDVVRAEVERWVAAGGGGAEPEGGGADAAERAQPQGAQSPRAAAAIVARAARDAGCAAPDARANAARAAPVVSLIDALGSLDGGGAGAGGAFAAGAMGTDSIAVAAGAVDGPSAERGGGAPALAAGVVGRARGEPRAPGTKAGAFAAGAWPLGRVAPGRSHPIPVPNRSLRAESQDSSGSTGTAAQAGRSPLVCGPPRIGTSPNSDELFVTEA